MSSKKTHRYFSIVARIAPMVLLFPGMVVPGFGAEITAKPVVQYVLSGSGNSYPSMSALIGNTNGAYAADFAKCKQKPIYNCAHFSLTGGAEATPFSVTINGIPNWVSLPRTAFWETKDHEGNITTSHNDDAGDLGAVANFICPQGYAGRQEGSGDTRTMTCTKVEAQSCPDEGNPINVATGIKKEHEVDYRSADGALRVERRYISQYTGWAIDDLPRLLAVAPGASVSARRVLHGGSRHACPDMTVATGRRYLDSEESPFASDSYAIWSCPDIYNNTDQQLVHLWMNGNHYRFVGPDFKADGLMGYRARLRPLAGANGEAWELELPSGFYWFDSAGYLLRSASAGGATLHYSWSAQGLASKRDQHGRTLYYHYDNDGRLTAITLPKGDQITYQYSTGSDPDQAAHWLLEKVAFPDGREMSYAYNEAAHIGSGTTNLLALTGKYDATGTRIGSYQYAFGRAISTEGALGAGKREIQRYSSFSYVTDALGTRRTVYFQKTLADGTRLHTGTVQPAGSGSTSGRDTLLYDDNGLLTQRTDYNGNKTQYAHDADTGLETVVVRGLSPSHSGNYRGAGVALPAGASKTTTEWHPRWRKPARVASPGLITHYIYNGDPDPFDNGTVAHCSSATLAGAPLPQLCREVRVGTLDSNGQTGLAATPDPQTPVQQRRYHYNQRGQLLSEMRPPRAEPVLTIDYYENTTADWTVGDIRRISNALGQQTDFHAYNADGYPLRVTDANGVETLFEYDAANRLTTRRTAGASTRHHYDINGLLSRSVLPNGVYLDYHYDAAQRLAGIEDGAGNRIDYQLDGEGNLLAEHIRDASGMLAYSRQQVFDALSRVMESVDADGQRRHYLYDRNGNLTRETNVRQFSADYGYDADNNRIRTTDALSGAVQISYDAQQRIRSVTDQNGSTTTYTYNGLGQLIRQQSPDTGTTTHSYDVHGNRTRSVDARGVVTDYQYDALERLLAITYPDSPEEAVSYHYDDGANGVGRLTGISDSGGSTRYQYDPHGNLIHKTSTIAGQSYRLDYRYDEAGLLTGIGYPDGLAVSYQRDSLGRIEQVAIEQPGHAPQVLASDLRYLPFGPLTGLDYGNGLRLDIGHDQNYRITSLRVGQLLDFSYAHDANGNVTTLDHRHQPGTSQTFDYDALDRLSGSDGPYGILDYQYDPVGNRLARDQQSDSGLRSARYHYAPDSNRLSRIDSSDASDSDQRHYSLDAAGNPLAIGDSDTTLASHYNSANRLARLTRNGVRTDYTYNALGQRVSKATQDPASPLYQAISPLLAAPPPPGTPLAIHYLYNEAGQLLGEYHQGQPLVRYIRLDSQPLAQVSAHGIAYYHNDHLGTPHALSDASQQPVWAATYTPFGDATLTIDTVTSHLRFPGQYFDIESGMHYNYFRDYDPGTGRYLQSDPIGLVGGINTYGYVYQNPLINIDPNGLEAIPHPAGLALGAGLLLGASLYSVPVIQEAVGDVADAIGNAVKDAARDEVDEGCPPEDDECDKLNRRVQDAKNEVGRLGACSVGMSHYDLRVRAQAWLDLARARAQRDQKCWNGGDAGHQQAQADAWHHVGQCQALMQ